MKPQRPWIDIDDIEDSPVWLVIVQFSCLLFHPQSWVILYLNYDAGVRCKRHSEIDPDLHTLKSLYLFYPHWFLFLMSFLLDCKLFCGHDNDNDIYIGSSDDYT